MDYRNSIARNLSYFDLSWTIRSIELIEGIGAINLEDNWVDEILIMKQETKDTHQSTCKKMAFFLGPHETPMKNKV